MNKFFPSKIILFGEYLLLAGGKALACSHHEFGGTWTFSKNGKPSKKQGGLHQFAKSEALQSIPSLDCARFSAELTQGIYFDSNIPSGYGLGSSGALVAAIYDRYANTPETDPTLLKQIFGRMESFFHGNSSGIDPLVSYLDTLVLIQENGNVVPLELGLVQKQLIGHLHLLNTRIARKTEPLVAIFKEKMDNPDFNLAIQRALLPTSNQAIDAFLEGDVVVFWEKLRILSELQFAHYQEFIPQEMHPIWKDALLHTHTDIKLCGAGGGGFFQMWRR